MKGDPEATEVSTLALDDGDIFVCQDGARHAPALLLIHGTDAFAGSWDEVVPLLARDHHVIRLDLLGCGQSAKPDDGNYDVRAQAHRAGVVLDRLGVERAIVVGHSSGGMVATSLAEQRSDLVTALVLVNTGPSMDAYISPGSAEIDPSQWPPTDEQIRRLASTGFARPDYPIPQNFVDEVRNSKFRVFAALMQNPREYLEQQTLPDRLKVLGTPLLVIFGEEDRRWRPSSAADYLAVPGARVEMLPGVGHTPILEDPLETATHLLTFAAIHGKRAD